MVMIWSITMNGPKLPLIMKSYMQWKSFDLQEIEMDINKVDGKKYTQGIKFTFHGEADPITYGK